MFYWLLYGIMLIGFTGCSLQSSDIKTKIIGLLLTVVNALLFWK